MKKVEYYICDYCHTRYKSNEECAKCEIGHKIPVRIAGMTYEPIKNDGRYPKKIHVKMLSGEIVTYKREEQ